MNDNIIMPIKYRTFTYHVIFDAIDVDKRLLDSDEFVFDLVHEIPSLVKMKILSGPNMVRDYDKENPGISCFAIIDYSHISIHTFTKTKEIYIDVFSCKKYDAQKIKKYLMRKLKITKDKVHCMLVQYPWERDSITI
jgi:S-adenosylmethionine decarboxylase